MPRAVCPKIAEKAMVAWFVASLLIVVAVTAQAHGVYVAPKPKNQRTFWWWIAHYFRGFVAYPCFILECLVCDIRRSGVISLAGWFVLAGLWIALKPISPYPFSLLAIFFLGSAFWFIAGYFILSILQEMQNPYPFADQF